MAGYVISALNMNIQRHHFRHVWNSFLTAFGFLLSPLSWWNDAVVNMPMAYLFSVPFTALDKRLFLPALLVGYWLTNLIGLVLMHHGIAGLARARQEKAKKVEWLKDLAVTAAYTLLIVGLVLIGWIKPHVEYLEHFR